MGIQSVCGLFLYDKEIRSLRKYMKYNNEILKSIIMKNFIKIFALLLCVCIVSCDDDSKDNAGPGACYRKPGYEHYGCGRNCDC